MTDEACDITILHFNDVYNVQENTGFEPVGGAARFVTAITHYESDRSLVLFSGDVFAPSTLSSITHGRHMVTVLNSIGIEAAVIGNHDFDFGVDLLLENMEKTNFTWLNSNCYDLSGAKDGDDDKLLADALPYKIAEVNGVRIGMIGLVEPEWVLTLSTVSEEDVLVKDFCEAGRAWAIELKSRHFCHIVVALTHMRWPNDEKLAACVPEIDLVLGGHDHDFNNKAVPPHNTHVIKSGTDFRYFSKIDFNVDKQLGKITHINVDLVEVNSSWEPNQEMSQYVSSCMGRLEENMKKPIGRVEVDLDLVFSHIRTRETNAGNLVADIMLRAVEADVALINSGTLRTDGVIPAGTFTFKHLHTMLPMLDNLVLLRVTGEQVLAAIENGVSQYPRLEGRFPQVAGISFAFDDQQPPGSRVLVESVRIQDEPLHLGRAYRLVTKSYLAQGKDGYDVFKKCPVLIDEENGPILSTVIQNYFRAIEVVNGFAKSRSSHRMSLVSLCNRRKISRPALASTQTSVASEAPSGESSKKSWKNVKKLILKEEQRFCKITCAVEGRIRIERKPQIIDESAELDEPVT